MIQIKVYKQPLSQWSEHLKQHEGSIFLSHEWLEAFKSQAGQPLYFLFYDQDSIKAVIAGLERPVGKYQKKQLFFFSGIASAGNHSGVLKECKIRLLEYARQNKYWRVVMKSYDCLRCRSAEVRDYISFKREEFVIDLTPNQHDIYQAMHPSIRGKIRKAKRNGLVLKQGDSPELLGELFLLINKTQQIRTRKGYGRYSPYSMPFLNQEIALYLLKNKLATIHYIEKGNKKLSLAFNVTMAQKAYGIWMGTSEEGYKAAAPSLLIYESLKMLKANGIIYLNLGGVPLGSKNQGIRKFKTHLGATAIDSAEQTTDFLIPPLSYLNHVLKLKRVVQDLMLPWRIKKILLQGVGLVLKDRDKY